MLRLELYQSSQNVPPGSGSELAKCCAWIWIRVSQMLRLELNCIHLEPKRLKFERKGIFIPFFTYVYTIKQPTVKYYLLVCIHHILLYCKETVLLLICVHCSGLETPFPNSSSYILDFPYCHTPFLKKNFVFLFYLFHSLIFPPGTP